MAKIDYLRGRKTRQVYLAALLTAVVAAAAEEQARQEAGTDKADAPCSHPPDACGCNVTK